MKRYINLFTILFYLCPVWCLAQTGSRVVTDSVPVAGNVVLQADTVRVDSLVNKKLQLAKEKFKPNPTKAVIYSAIIPGLGQIYNRKYWKLPLVYGSFIGCAYAITWNGNQYNGYRKAYKDYIDGNPNTNSWDDYRYGSYLKTDPENWTSDMQTNFQSSLKSARDYYRRYRDMSYIITVGVYAIWIIDAYVDAQLFDFDISPDLSMHVAPVLFDRTAMSDRSVGMQLSFNF